jgi:sterol 14-demethylase
MSGGLPLLGPMLAFQRDPLQLLDRGRRKHGDLFQFRLMGRRFVLFLGPAAQEAYFRASDTQLSQKEVYRFTIPIFGKGVAYDVASDVMSEQVSFLHPGLRESRMKSYAAMMVDEVETAIGRWDDEGEIDLAGFANELTLNIACRCLLGDEIRRHVDSTFAPLYRDLQGGINAFGFFFPHLPVPAHLRRDRARRKVAEFIGGILSDRRRAGHGGDDLMQLLLEARYSDGRPLSDEEITGILLTALFAGQHTSGVLATWAGLELAANPQFVQPILEEASAIYGAGEPISFASLRRQRRLERAIREAERMHPPLSFLVRKVIGDFRYRGRLIPRGSMAMVSPALAHRLPDVFPDPDRYNPDRFEGPDGDDKTEPYSLITFGGGRHRCIGTHFAYMQIMVIWTLLLQRFAFELEGAVPAPDYGEWVTGPKPPFRLRYRRRINVNPS